VRFLRESDRLRRVGVALAAASAVATVIGLLLFLVSGARFTDSFMLQNALLALALAVAFALMVRQQPHNGAVWTLGWAMAIAAFTFALPKGVIEHRLSRVVDLVGIADDVPLTFGDLPTGLAWLINLQELAWVYGWLPLMTLALLLFPDGRLPSRRFRLAVIAAVAAMVVFTVPFWVAWRPQARAEVAVGEYRYTTFLHVADVVGALLFAGAFVAAIASLVVRYRRESGDARRQIRWIAMGGGFLGVVHLLWVIAIVDFDLAERLVWVGVLASIPVLVAAYAVAILRYRLYDIDVVLSRSLVVAALAGFIAVVYIAVVVGVGALLGVRGEASLGLQVVATAIVAVAFQPLRQRSRRWADRLVYGHRATPYEVLSRFSRLAANAGDEANLQRIADVLAAGTGAAPATLWLRVGDHLRPAASSGAADSEGTTSVPLLDGDLPDLPASLVVPVRHDDELLGAVSLTKQRSEPPTPQDEELSRRLARGLALALRNARLTAELQDHLDALEASRSRLMRAQDEARRQIEGELRHGAQRHLEELKSLLGLARQRSAGADATRVAALLEQLEGDTDDAVNTLRTLAQGIYPPVLEAEGLGAAVAAHANRSTLPITAHAPGLPRYPSEVETAVYFSVLEALQNAAKYAHASSVHARLEQRDDELWFEVSDDGVGFDPLDTNHGSGLKGIAERLDTIGGVVEVRSRPGAGTRVIGRVPVVPAVETSPEAETSEVPA
jgi:signal transduction histidine kinase